MANERSWLWRTGDNSTLYVQIDDVNTSKDQVVFKWTTDKHPVAYLRSSRETLTDCQLSYIDNKGCTVILGEEIYKFFWQNPTQSRQGLIAEGISSQKATTWASRRQQNGNSN